MGDDRTLSHYNSRAQEVAVRYETADMDRLHRLLRATLAPGARILELGCGSGRDSALVLTAGFSVTATDGSTAMLAEALRMHPELAGRLHHLVFPGRFPFPDASYDAVLANATLMHLGEPDILATLREVTRVLSSGGALIFSVPGRRPDVGPEGRDHHGRLFTMVPESRWIELCGEASLRIESRCTGQDRLGRDSVEWWTFVARKDSSAGA